MTVGVVVDASSLLLAAQDPAQDPRADAARRVLPELHGSYGVMAPALLAYEVAHVVHRKAPRAFGSDAAGRAGVVATLLTGIELHAPTPELLHRTGALSEERGLTAYDASYLALTERAGDGLLTDDAALREAAAGAGITAWIHGVEGALDAWERGGP